MVRSHFLSFVRESSRACREAHVLMAGGKRPLKAHLWGIYFACLSCGQNKPLPKCGWEGDPLLL